jgi:hypothetical protein
VEIDPAYVDVAVTRWQAFTGQTAMLDGEEQSFADIGAQRRAGGYDPEAASHAASQPVAAQRAAVAATGASRGAS